MAKLGLALNDEFEEGKPLTEQEETKLKDEIVAKLEDPTVMESFDETSRVRIFRGMITNNNGTDEENVQEAIETYGTVGKWLREHPSILSEKITEGGIIEWSHERASGRRGLPGALSLVRTAPGTSRE